MVDWWWTFDLPGTAAEGPPEELGAGALCGIQSSLLQACALGLFHSSTDTVLAN